MKLPDTTKARISKTLLDVAEALPSFNGSIVQLFQVIRKHQREDAERTYQQSRLPQGSQITNVYLRLFEIYTVEELDHLIDNLTRLFPLYSASNDEPFSAIKYQAKHLTSLRWLNVSTIGLRNGLFFTPRYRHFKLPTEVDHIDIQLIQLLPSIFVVTLDAHLTVQAQDQLKALQDKRYLPRVIFTKTIPLRERDWGYSSTMAEGVMRHEIELWSIDLRRKIEKALRPVFAGQFQRHRSDGAPQLPCIEVHFLEGLSGDGKDLIKNWIHHWIAWLETRGFDLELYESFSDGKVLFIPSEDGSTAHKLVVLTHTQPQSDASGNPITKSGLIQDSKYIVNELTSTLAIWDFLRLTQRTVEDLRLTSFGKSKRTWVPGLPPTAYARLNENILHTSMLLDRIATEFDEMRSFFLHSPWIHLELRQLTEKDDGKQFKELYVEAIDLRIKLLRRHITIIKDWLSQFLALRNNQAMFWLTVIIALAAVVGIVGTENIQNALHWLATAAITLIRNLFGWLQ